MSEPQPSPANRRKDLITEFREAYATHVAEAGKQQELTDTEGWRSLYAQRRKDDGTERRKLAEDLKRLAMYAEETGLGETGEKELGEIKKSSAALRDQQFAFETDTVGPVKRPTVEAGKVIEEFRRRAEREEAATPLMNVGLVELMKDAIRESVRVRWDEETGRVVVGERE